MKGYPSTETRLDAWFDAELRLQGWFAEELVSSVNGNTAQPANIQLPGTLGLILFGQPVFGSYSSTTGVEGIKLDTVAINGYAEHTRVNIVYMIVSNV